MISSTDSPSARLASTTATGIRVPRMQALPWSTAGLTVMCSCQSINSLQEYPEAGQLSNARAEPQRELSRQQVRAVGSSAWLYTVSRLEVAWDRRCALSTPTLESVVR